MSQQFSDSPAITNEVFYSRIHGAARELVYAEHNLNAFPYDEDNAALAHCLALARKNAEEVLAIIHAKRRQLEGGAE